MEYRVAEFYNRLTDKWEIRKDDFYLRYEGSLDIEEFKGGRIFPVRSIYSFIETCLPYLNADMVEEDVIEDMEYSGRCEADELIHYIWESAKYSSLAMRELDAWYD